MVNSAQQSRFIPDSWSCLGLGLVWFGKNQEKNISQSLNPLTLPRERRKIDW